MDSAVHSAPVVVDGLVYAAACSSCGSEAARYVKMGTRDLTVAFDAGSGKEVWRFPNGKYASPVIADQDRIYLTGRSFLYGLDPKQAVGQKKAASVQDPPRKKRRRRGR